MRAVLFVLSCLAATCLANSNLTDDLKSQQVLSSFRPPQVFRNVNLVRNVNLEKGYPRETVNVVIENTSQEPQAEYYLPFEPSVIGRVGGLEARDKKDASKGTFDVEVVEYDTESATEFYKITLPSPLAPSEQQTLSITYTVLSALRPLPATIGQTDQQFVVYTLNSYTPSAYPTTKQKTKVKFPGVNVPDYTVLPDNSEGQPDPQKQGSSFTYGPYNDVPAGATQPVTVRYEFTKPLIHATRLERDVEVSHWGGNLATEERYWLTNNGAKLKNHFSRVSWQMAAYANPPTSALKELKMPLKVGSANAYFTDDIGNVSTSRFRSGPREAMLEIKPRYPVFGGWNYSFRVGWDNDLGHFLRKVKGAESYVLKVPFLEGPKMSEGVEIERVDVRVILPEGAQNIKFETTVPIVLNETSLHRTFMDTIGRTSLKITALNVVDELRDRDLIVTYDYPWTAGYRKPLTIFGAVLALFVASWVVGNIDTSIGKTKQA